MMILSELFFEPLRGHGLIHERTRSVVALAGLFAKTAQFYIVNKIVIRFHVVI